MKSFTTQFFFPSPDEQDRPGSISFSGTSTQTIVDLPGDGTQLDGKHKETIRQTV